MRDLEEGGEWEICRRESIRDLEKGKEWGIWRRERMTNLEEWTDKGFGGGREGREYVSNEREKNER